MSFQSRDIRHFLNAGVTLAVDVKDGKARVAVAFLNRSEPRYSRPAARAYIDLRFDADDSTLKSLGITRNVYSFPYVGKMPRADILFPLSDALQAEMERRIKHDRKPGRVVEMRQIIRQIASDRIRESQASKGEQVPV